MKKDINAVQVENSIFEMAKQQSDKNNEELIHAYTQIAYDKIGQIFFAKDDFQIQSIIKDIETNVAGWDASVYKVQQNNYNLLLDNSIQKPKAIKGLHKCKCGNDEFYIWSAQTRSGDEGMTHFRQCAKCGKRGKE